MKSVDPSPTRQLAAFSAGVSSSAIPDKVFAKARDLFLDYLGGTAVVVAEDPAQRLIRFARSVGGQGQAGILGTDARVAAPWAAFVNGAMGHMAELDDTHRGTMSHPGDSVWATALALAEQTQPSVEEFLIAAIVGYEVALRIGEAVMPDHYTRGWHTSGTIMAFGAAATASRLLKLNAEATAWAFGTAGAQASGNFAHLSERAMTKDFNCGHAAKSGTIAALLAKEGFTGPTDVLENRNGFLKLYGGEVFPEKLTAGLNESWRTLDIAHKPYSACRHIHASIDALLHLKGSLNFAADDVESLTARIFSTGAAFVNDPEPWEGNKGMQGARFSAQFNLAVVLMYGQEGLWGLLDTRQTRLHLQSPEVRQRTARIKVVADEALNANFPNQWSSIVEVRLLDGRSGEHRVDYPLGEPETPMGSVMLEEKFRRLSALGGATSEWSEQIIRDVAGMTSADELKSLLLLLYR